MASDSSEGSSQGGYNPIRRHTRYELTAFVDVTGSLKHPYQHVQNISLGGICIHTPAQEPPGTVVDLVVFFPDLDATFESQGEVVWVSSDDRLDMGVRFIGLDPARQAILERYFARVRRNDT